MTAVALPAPRVAWEVRARAAAVVGAALVLAALSLLRPWAVAFDPMAWLVWGREVGRLTLDTGSGPSWKPFPVLFTTPFALFGSAAPALWLIVARAGGLLALAGACALATRLAGRWAGVAAVAAMALSPWWAYNTLLGNSEGLLAAAVLWALLAHLADRPQAALACATAAALMRPEVWPFLIVYGVWLWRSRPETRRAVLIAAVVVPVLWFGPDVVGAGGALGASTNARGGDPSPGSAKLASIPALAVFKDTSTISTLPAVLLALLGTVLSGPLGRRLFLAAAGWVLIVAAMTTAGYAGNPRYLVAASAVLAALAGAGAVRGAAAVHRAAAPVGAIVLVGLVLAVTSGTLRSQFQNMGDRAASAAAFDGVIARAGGKDALQSCSRIRTSASARSFVAWRLDLPLRDLDAHPYVPAVILRANWFYGRGFEPSPLPGFKTAVTGPSWQVVEACGPAPQKGRLPTDPKRS